MEVVLPANRVFPARANSCYTAAMVRGRACNVAFSGPLVTNSLRGLVAEAIVASALEPEWSWCAADWAGWDFERSDGLKLEVKQSAARQTWSKTSGKVSPCRFDIKARSGYYHETEWHAGEGRVADIYVFAHHFVCDTSADHCEPGQWRFFVIPESSLPQAKTIGLATVVKLVSPRGISELAQEVGDCADSLKRMDS